MLRARWLRHTTTVPGTSNKQFSCCCCGYHHTPTCSRQLNTPFENSRWWRVPRCKAGGPHRQPARRRLGPPARQAPIARIISSLVAFCCPFTALACCRYYCCRRRFCLPAALIAAGIIASSARPPQSVSERRNLMR